VWVLSNRLFEIRNRLPLFFSELLLEPFSKLKFVCLTEVEAAIKVRIESFAIHRAETPQMLLLLRRHLCLNFLGDGARHRTLKGENIAQIAVIGLSPQVRISRRIDQLGRNPHPVT